MIKIKIFSVEQKIVGVSVSGHAGYATAGEDIVCAGVSALVQSALLGLMIHLKRKVDYAVDKGWLRMRLQDPPDDLTEAVLVAMLLGLKEIAKQFPERVRIIQG